MIHSSSSEEEVIRRGRQVRQKIEYSEESYEEEDLNPIFYEVFGTGHEYDYIYENEENEEENEYLEDVDLGDKNEDKCLSYVSYIMPHVEDEIVKALFKGFTPEHVSFQCDKCSIKEAYFIKGYVDEYFQIKEDEIKKHKTLRAFQMHRGDQEDLKIPGILDLSNYLENIKIRERIIEPEGILDPDFENSDSFKKVVNQLSKNSFFIDTIYRIYETKIMEMSTAAKQDVVTFVKNSTEMENLKKFYCTYEGTTPENNTRARIIDLAFDAIGDNCYYPLMEKMIDQGMIPGYSGLQELTDLLISLNGRFGEYVGLFMDGKFVKMVKIDEMGKLDQNNFIIPMK